MKYQLSLAGLLALARNTVAQCSGTFEDMTAEAFLAASNPAWNLGNTLDAIPDEGSWNNPPVVAATFDAVKAAGFKSVRIPVTYTHHFVSEAPDYEVDPQWLQRVSDVIDFALERDLFVVTNVHHDSWEWADVSASDADVEAIQAKFRALWVQIGEKLACKPSSVAFESINEPPAQTAEDGAHVNEFNTIFLDALSETGDWNTRRVVTLAGGNNDATKTSQWFEPPAEVANPWALQIHYYSPYDFVFSAWGKTIWGSTEDKAAMDSELGLVRGNFTDVPIYVGEFSATPQSTESAARWKWFDYFVSAATDIDAAVALWDNGLDYLDRETGEFRDPTVVDIIRNAANGVANSLPDSTVDASATEQWTSAYISNQVGAAITEQKLPYLFNGNTVESITTSEGTKLAQGTDYTVGCSSITFAPDFIRTYITADSEPGVYETLTIDFSAGASTTATIVQWDAPTLESTEGTAVTGQDLVIPIEWAGLERLATVKFVAEDGTYLVDDWTQYLGPLQQGRGTWDGQWSFEGDNVIIRASIIDMVVSLGQPVTFTFEFYPRVEGNVVEYVLTP
ncbi:glycoside hydrolase superfamily [Emericellopsis atlantica]|uniref:Glycoside hydrolase superfamily n=1 Tax=Emericellopsis atlantica TaxID=2614577 RepID=A0A9P7ZHN1_9HYPO|nr:glycoside hydrolase superfamily [Emericellopsis atlantica]KAG9251901.1 glycoside hydrolase superfamily [Emericellopsis atlantica]